MKKFFKALALVLALTLVVGVVPATAARAEVMKDKTLYIDGAQGKSEDGKACSVKAKKAIYKLAGYTKDEKDNHDLKAVSADASIAKTTKNYVKAVAIGTTTVDIYDGDVKIGTTTIKVKKNASADTLVLKVDDGDVPEKLTAGGKYTFKLPRAGKDTDERRIFVNGTQLTDIKDHARQFEYTVTEDDAKAGKITVKYESYQSKTYNAYTQTKTVEIPVVLGTMEKATQITYNTFRLKFSNEGVAKAAVDATKPSLNQGTADVTEKDQLIKVFQVGANGEEIAAFIESFSINATDKSLVAVTMFADLAEKATYKVVYGESSLTFVAADWTPESVKGYEKTYTPVDDGENQGGTATLDAIVYSVGDQGQDVDITEKVKDLGTFNFSDPNQAKNDYTKYSLNGDIVDFYVNDYKIQANVVFTYFGGTTPVEYPNTFDVSSSDERTFTVLYYYMDANLNTKDPGTKREAFISADDNTMMLDVRIKSEIVIDGVKVIQDQYIYGDNSNVKFVTANTDKLAVDKTSGASYAPKKADATVPVWVYYGDKVVDADATVDGVQPIYVTVYDHRMLGNATLVDTTDGKIGYNTTAYRAASNNLETVTYEADGYAADSEIWKLTTTDAQGRPYNDVTVTVETITAAADYAVAAITPNVNVAGAEWQLSSIWNSDKNAGFMTFTSTTADTSVQTVAYKVTVQDNNSSKKLVFKISFRVKNTSTSKVTRYAVVTDDSNVRNITAKVLGYDNAGYTVCQYLLDTTTDLATFKDLASSNRIYLGFFRSADGSETTKQHVDVHTEQLAITESKLGGGLTKISSESFLAAGSTVGIVSGGAATALGVTTAGAIDVAKYDRTNGTALKYIADGTYVARAYYNGGSKAVGIGTSNVKFAAPSYYAITWNWNKAYTTETNTAKVIDEALRFTVYYYNVEWTTTGGITNTDGTQKWEVKKADGLKYSQLVAAGIPVTISYTEKPGTSLTILYVYVNEGQLAHKVSSTADLYRETPILRTIYTNIEK